jgi:uncharacterized membrane protein
MFEIVGKSKFLFLLVVFLQFIFDITVLFNIPIIREVIGFVYLTFIPGLLVVRLLKLNEEFAIWEILLFSVGISIAFAMVVGLFINQLFSMFCISQPLSLIPLIIIFNIFILVIGIFVYIKKESHTLCDNNSTRFFLHMLPLAFLPFLSFAGVFWVNVEGNNVLLLFMILAIALLFVISIFSKSMITSELYPFAILMMAIALLFHSSLISDYIASFGSDVPVEYFVFKATKNNAYWNSAPAQYWGLEFGRINAMLSVTVLPTIYSIFLNMDPVWVFKVIFSLLFCFVPLGLYQMWQKYIDKKYAFISAFLFVAQETFYTEMLGLNRQIIAELFFVLLLFVILDKRMKQFSKIICFLIFSFGLVTSHYGISVIFLLILSFTFWYRLRVSH